MAAPLVRVVQNAAAFINRETTPPEIVGLATEGLGTRVAIMASGRDGVVLIRDSRVLSEDSMIAVLRRIGALDFWATAFDPYMDTLGRYYSDNRRGHSFNHEVSMGRINPILERVWGADFQQRNRKYNSQAFYPVEDNQYVWIRRDGEIFIDGLDDIGRYAPRPGDARVIRGILQRNQCSLGADEGLECFLEYDGLRHVPMPALTEATLRMERIQVRFGRFIRELGRQRNWELAALEEERQENWELVVRQAADGGTFQDVEDIEFLLGRRFPINVNAREPETRRTALHFAAARRHRDVVRLLLEHGADREVEDREGNRPDLGFLGAAD